MNVQICKPLLSIIVPVYNQERYLDVCIESIAKQDYHNMEIILVDDGSTDNSPYICDKWLEKDSRIRVVHTSSRGLSAARNTGLDISTGVFVTFVDSDDYISEGTYSNVMLEISDDIDIIQYPYQSFPHGDDYMTLSSLKFMDKGSIGKGIFRNQIIMALWNKIFKKEIIKGHRFKETYFEDTPFMISLFESGATIKTTSVGCYMYRRHEASITGSSLTLQKKIDKSASIFARISFLEKYCINLDRFEKVEFKYFMLISAFRPLVSCRPFVKEESYLRLCNCYNANNISIYDILSSRMETKQLLILLYEKLFGRDRLIMKITHQK